MNPKGSEVRQGSRDQNEHDQNQWNWFREYLMNPEGVLSAAPLSTDKKTRTVGISRGSFLWVLSLSVQRKYLT